MPPLKLLGSRLNGRQRGEPALGSAIETLLKERTLPRLKTDSVRYALKLEDQHGSGVGQVLQKGLQPLACHIPVTAQVMTSIKL